MPLHRSLFLLPTPSSCEVPPGPKGPWTEKLRLGPGGGAIRRPRAPSRTGQTRCSVCVGGGLGPGQEAGETEVTTCVMDSTLGHLPSCGWQSRDQQQSFEGWVPRWGWADMQAAAFLFTGHRCRDADTGGQVWPGAWPLGGAKTQAVSPPWLCSARPTPSPRASALQALNSPRLGLSWVTLLCSSRQLSHLCWEPPDLGLRDRAPPPAWTPPCPPGCPSSLGLFLSLACTIPLPQQRPLDPNPPQERRHTSVPVAPYTGLA